MCLSHPRSTETGSLGWRPGTRIFSCAAKTENFCPRDLVSVGLGSGLVQKSACIFNSSQGFLYTPCFDNQWILMWCVHPMVAFPECLVCVTFWKHMGKKKWKEKPPPVLQALSIQWAIKTYKLFQHSILWFRFKSGSAPSAWLGLFSSQKPSMVD